MNLATIIGMFGGIAVVLYGIMVGGNLGDFWNLDSVFIVIGGTFLGGLACYSMKDFIDAMKVAAKAFGEQKFDVQGAIDTIINLANTARKEGLLFLEDSVKSLGEPFLQKGILLIIDGTDPELVKGILETELSYIEERHEVKKSVFETLGLLAPAFGMIGTLVGLINMLKSLSDPSSLGPAMSVALITTFYGSFLANLVFNPIAWKLKELTNKEILYKTVLIEGMLSIQAGENPRIIQEKLMSFLPASEHKAEVGAQ